MATSSSSPTCSASEGAPPERHTARVPSLARQVSHILLIHRTRWQPISSHLISFSSFSTSSSSIPPSSSGSSAGIGISTSTTKAPEDDDDDEDEDAEGEVDLDYFNASTPCDSEYLSEAASDLEESEREAYGRGAFDGGLEGGPLPFAAKTGTGAEFR